jgi:hypothetical protein
MSPGYEIALYSGASASTFLLAVLMLRWARPVNGELSHKLRRAGMETFIAGAVTTVALLGLACTIGAVLAVLKLVIGARPI